MVSRYGFGRKRPLPLAWADQKKETKTKYLTVASKLAKV
jgi:hypothetical protein